MRQLMAKWLLFTVAYAVLCVATSNYASAAEDGECFTVAQLNSTMISEKQSSVFKVDGVAAKEAQMKESELALARGWIFTVNPATDEGYIIVTNAASQKPFEKACIFVKLSHVRFEEAGPIATIPRELLLPHEETEDAAKSDCRREVLICGLHNDLISSAVGNGARVIYFGQSKRGEIFTVFEDIDDRRVGFLGQTDPSRGLMVIRYRLLRFTMRRDYEKMP